MTGGSDDRQSRGPAEEDRRKRLGTQLKANLARRKAQARARGGSPDNSDRTGEDTPADEGQ